MSIKCNWIEDFGHETSCGEGFIFTEESVIANRFKFCPFCGKEIEEWTFVPSRDVFIGRDKMVEAAVPEYWENSEGDKVYDKKEIK